MDKVKEKVKSFAIWACGPPATGKNRICEAAILPLGFELIDFDKTYEELLNKYKLSIEYITSNKEHREHSRAIQYARRMAEKLANGSGSNGFVDPGKFISKMNLAIKDGKLGKDFVRDITVKVQKKAGTEPISVDSFRKAIFPKMSDWSNPLDYLKDKKPVTDGHIQAAAREISRRNFVEYQRKGKNILFIETGGQTGKLINMKTALEAEGCKTFLVWIYLESVEEAMKRNEARKKSGGRGLDAAIIERGFKVAETSREQLLSEFHPNTIEINNTQRGDECVQTRIEELQSIIQKWMVG